MGNKLFKPDTPNSLSRLKDAILKPRSDTETRDMDFKSISSSPRIIANAIASTQILETDIRDRALKDFLSMNHFRREIPGSNFKAMVSASCLKPNIINSLFKSTNEFNLLASLEKEFIAAKFFREYKPIALWKAGDFFTTLSETQNRHISLESRESVKKIAELAQGLRVEIPPRQVPAVDTPRSPTVAPTPSLASAAPALTPTPSLAPLLDPESAYSPPEVRIGVEAWAAVLQGGNPRDNGIGVTSSIRKWLKDNKTALESRHRVRLTTRTIDRIATVFNWHKDGGLPSRKK